MRIVTLPGHTHGMIGVITPDQVFYCGDAIFDEKTRIKNPVLLYNNMKQALETFTKMEGLDVKKTVLYHGGLCENLQLTVQEHRQLIQQLLDTVFNFCTTSKSPSIDELTQKIMQHYSVSDSIYAFSLTKASVNACITCLEEENRIQLHVSSGLLSVEPIAVSALTPN